MIDKFIERYKKFVFGSDTAFDVRRRVFLLITHISIIIAFIGVFVDIAFNMGLFLIIITSLTTLLLIYFHIKVRDSGLRTKYSVGFFILSIIILPLLWIYNGGLEGNNIILIFVYFSVILTILPSGLRIYALIVFAFMVMALTLLHFYYPNLITPYENQQYRIVDLMIGYVMYLLLAYNIQNIILKNYETDRIQINLQNEQLNSVVAELNETNIKLEQSIKNIQELNLAKDRFITVLSHDLRSPFQGLMGISKTLESDFDSFSDDEKKYYLSQMNTSLDKLYAFLEQLLLWGRIQRDTLKLKFEDTNIGELIERSLSPLTSSISKKKLTISKNCKSDLMFVLDKETISIVIRNLLSNAIKFSPVGSFINVSAKVVNQQLVISVKDEGIGISEVNLAKLFRIDENVSTPGIDGEIGSGMGLILCNDIIKKHNGSISVESKEGKGTTFVISIPKNLK